MASSSPHTLYYERLSPGPGMWFLTLCAGGASYLVGAPIGIPVGIIAAVVVTLLLGWILYFSAPTIEISQDWVRVGRASIERAYVGETQAFRGEQARIAAGPDLDGRAYMCFRGWITPKIRLDITDPADPTPIGLLQPVIPKNSRDSKRLVLFSTKRAVSLRKPPLSRMV